MSLGCKHKEKEEARWAQECKLKAGEEKIDLQNTQIVGIIQFLRSKGFNDIYGSGGSSFTS